MVGLSMPLERRRKKSMFKVLCKNVYPTDRYSEVATVLGEAGGMQG